MEENEWKEFEKQIDEPTKVKEEPIKKKKKVQGVVGYTPNTRTDKKGRVWLKLKKEKD